MSALSGKDLRERWIAMPIGWTRGDISQITHRSSAMRSSRRGILAAIRRIRRSRWQGCRQNRVMGVVRQSSTTKSASTSAWSARKLVTCFSRSLTRPRQNLMSHHLNSMNLQDVRSYSEARFWGAKSFSSFRSSVRPRSHKFYSGLAILPCTESREKNHEVLSMRKRKNGDQTRRYDRPCSWRGGTGANGSDGLRSLRIPDSQ